MNILAALALTLIPIAIVFVTYLKVTRGMDTLRNLKHSETLHDFLTSKRGLYFVMVWSVAESLYWWVFPDYLMMLTGVYVRRFHPKIFIYATIGTAIGGVGAYLTGRLRPLTSAAMIAHVPFVTGKMRLFAEQKMEEQGVVGVIHHPTSGVPFKVFAHLAGQRHLNFAGFISLGISLRAARFIFTYVATFSFAKLFGERLRKLPVPLVLISATVIYTIALTYVQKGRRLSIK